jgi:hypothetical protein
LLYFAQTIELVPPERRTIKLFREHEENLLGFVSWQLRASGETTMVGYDVYVQFTEPADSPGKEPAMAGNAPADKRQLEDRTRFQEELQELKQLVERDRSVGGCHDDLQ